jgi:EAL domain-containing protein (putative c-di-GMP-specific phosphodiesterase class I)
MGEKKQDGETTQFIKQMDGVLLGWEQPEARLREALDHDHFVLFAQPVRAMDGQAPGLIAFAEVLLRLREGEIHEDSLTLPPGDFLPAFRHYGMILELDRWVLRHALATLGASRGIGRLSLNVSGETLEDESFAAFAAEMLRSAAVAPSALIIELDENDAIDRRAAAVRFAGEMKAIGCGLLIDGFARRSVSFEVLQALQADFVKVDGALVRNLRRSASATSKLKAVLRVGKATGVGVIAECVEDDQILGSLQLLKAGYVQGYGVDRPVPLQQLLN